jgi:antitoxin PrlF
MEAIQEISTITAKGQTTVPKAVRQALGVGTGDRITFRIDAQGVTVHRADDEEDPVVTAYLALLGKDMETRAAVTPFPAALAARIQGLTEGVAVDIEAPIDGEVDL